MQRRAADIVAIASARRALPLPPTSGRTVLIGLPVVVLVNEQSGDWATTEELKRGGFVATVVRWPQRNPATMNFTLFDLAGFIGVLLIAVAYLLLQLDKLPSSSPSYSLLNAAGALLIMVSLLFKFNFSAFLVEVFWFLISLLGLSRWLISRKRLRIKGKTIRESNTPSGQQ